MLKSDQHRSKSLPAQVVEGALILVVLSLPLYLAGYHHGAAPTIGVAVAMTLGALGVFTVTANGVAPAIRAALGAFSLHRITVWLVLLFLGCMLYASLVLSEPGSGTMPELLMSNRYSDPLKPLSHLLFGAGNWAVAQLLLIAHAICREVGRTSEAASQRLVSLRMHTVLRALPLMMLGILALLPAATLIVLPLMLVALIHLRDELLRVRAAAQL